MDYYPPAFRQSPLSIILICLVFSASGCLGIRPSGIKSDQRLFETFYAGEGGMQYFIKPLHFACSPKKSEIRLDFSFRHQGHTDDSVIVNFSFYMPELSKETPALLISNGHFELQCQSVQLLFQEQKKKTYHHRFTSKCSLRDLKTLFQKPEWQPQILFRESRYFCLGTKKIHRKISSVRDKLFVLF